MTDIPHHRRVTSMIPTLDAALRFVVFFGLGGYVGQILIGGIRLAWSYI